MKWSKNENNMLDCYEYDMAEKRAQISLEIRKANLSVAEEKILVSLRLRCIRKNLRCVENSAGRRESLKQKGSG